MVKALTLSQAFSNKHLNTSCADAVGLGKGHFVSIKGHLCLIGHLAKPEGQVETKSPSLEVIFDTTDLNFLKKSKRALINKASDLQMLYLSK